MSESLFLRAPFFTEPIWMLFVMLSGGSRGNIGKKRVRVSLLRTSKTVAGVFEKIYFIIDMDPGT